MQNERARLTSAPAGDQKMNSDLLKWDNETDEQPLAITNGDTDAEPSNLASLPPSGLTSTLRNAPRTAGARGRNTTSLGNKMRPNSLNLHAAKARRESGGNHTMMGKIDQNKYITERDLQFDLDKTQNITRKSRVEKANY